MRISNLKTLLFIFFSTSLIGQDLEMMEDSLSWTKSDEKYGDKIPTALRILEMDAQNFKAHYYIVRSYVNLKNWEEAVRWADSVSIEFSQNGNLIFELALGLQKGIYKKPENPTNLANQNLMRKALAIEESRSKAAFYLSHYWYRKFISEMKEDPPSHFTYEEVGENHYNIVKSSPDYNEERLKNLLDNARENPETKMTADSAQKYLIILVKSDSKYRRVMKYTLAQVDYFLGKTANDKLDSTCYEGFYFPDWYFGYFPKNFHKNITLNLFLEAWNAADDAHFISEHLKHFEEPFLFDHRPIKPVYRLTFLPSFSAPICIRLENSEGEYLLHWTAGKGKGGYKPEGILKRGTEKLEKNEFEEITHLLALYCCEDDLTVTELTGMFDGTTYIIEKSTAEGYKAFKTNLAYEIDYLIMELGAKYFPEVEIPN